MDERRERGSALPLLALVILLAGGTMLVLGRIGGAALDRARARSAAAAAAPPGESMHERGLAIDVPLDFVPRLLAVAARVGLCHPYAATDPVHFEMCAV